MCDGAQEIRNGSGNKWKHVSAQIKGFYLDTHTTFSTFHGILVTGSVQLLASVGVCFCMTENNEWSDSYMNE